MRCEIDQVVQERRVYITREILPVLKASREGEATFLFSMLFLISVE